MGVIIDFIKDLPLTAIMRERLIDFERQMAVLEKENAILKAENTILKAQNAELILKIQDYEKSSSVGQDPCPYCQKEKGELIDIVPHPIFGSSGIKIAHYECTNCRKQYERERDHNQAG
jgi:uncharacterized protein with PIN domain